MTETATETPLTTGDGPTAEPLDSHDEHHGDMLYVQVALMLAVITAVEVLTYFVDFGAFAVPSLLIMMVAKAVLVLLFFMHLKDDHNLFSAMFVIGVVLAAMVYLATLIAFEFFA